MNPSVRLTRTLSRLGRVPKVFSRTLLSFLRETARIASLTGQAFVLSAIAPFQRRGRFREQLVPMLYNVGVRSSPIVMLVSTLIGAILVINTGNILRDYGQTGLLPKAIALAVTREFGPVMTAIIITARVGASFTAVLASMKINEEVMALETMAISPVRFLVVPRLVAMLIMVPSLTVISYAVGMLGGAFAAAPLYGIPLAIFIRDALGALAFHDLSFGLVKAFVFGTLICMICCYYGLTTTGGAMGLGRNTMVAVVTSLVSVIIANLLLGTVFVKFIDG